jgi:hypothetical protein
VGATLELPSVRYDSRVTGAARVARLSASVVEKPGHDLAEPVG